MVVASSPFIRRQVWMVSLLALLGIVTFEFNFHVDNEATTTTTNEGMLQLSLRFKNYNEHSSGNYNNYYTAQSNTNHTDKQHIVMMKDDDDKDDDDDRTTWPSRDVLKRIAVDNTIITISATCGYVEMAQNWILHVRKLNITNYIVIAQDDSVYPVLENFAPGHVVMLNRNISAEVNRKAFRFNSEGFYKVCKQRPHMIQSILDQGYRVLYSDTDLVWLKNPFERLPDTVDYVGLVDDYVGPEQEEDIDVICSAMLYLKPNKNVARMMSYWNSLMVEDEAEKGHDQNHWRTTLKTLKGNYSMHVLDKYEFPPGFLFFDVNKLRAPAGNLTKQNVYTVHANWMSGYKTKVKNLKKKHLWLVDKDDALICKRP